MKRHLRIGIGAALLGAGAWLVLRKGGRQPDGTPALITAPGVVYQTTWEDWLWIARSCLGEAGEQEWPYVIWAEVQRFVAARQAGWTTASSLGTLVRYFSKAINPHWINGTGPAAGLAEAGDPQMSPEAVAHRREISGRSWDWLLENRPRLFDLVTAIGDGVGPDNPFPAPWRNSNNFGSSPRDREAAAAGRAYRPVPGGNVYYPDSPRLVGPVELR